jgi:hypothetical protein
MARAEILQEFQERPLAAAECIEPGMSDDETHTDKHLPIEALLNDE